MKSWKLLTTTRLFGVMSNISKVKQEPQINVNELQVAYLAFAPWNGLKTTTTRVVFFDCQKSSCDDILNDVTNRYPEPTTLNMTNQKKSLSFLAMLSCCQRSNLNLFYPFFSHRHIFLASRPIWLSQSSTYK